MRTVLQILAVVAFLPVSPAPGGEIIAERDSVTISPGTYQVGNRLVTVTERATLRVEAAPILTVSNEPLKLSVDMPVGWAKGTRLRACNARDVNACGSFVPGSLEIRRSSGGELLVEGKDYLVDTDWGHVGLGPKSSVTDQLAVFASYRYSLLRVDTLQVSADGKASLKQGEPHISAPVPPEADMDCVAIAHLFVNYRTTEVNADAIYPIQETAAQAATATALGRIPKTLAKLRSGQPVTIVCWGDSVTAGGNASQPALRYVDVFAAGLRSRFPNSTIDVQNISLGGSGSRQWLHPDQHSYRGLAGSESPAQFDRILRAKPDLVSIEFVNDAGMTPEKVEETYGEILKRLEPTGAEVILITPHFTMWRMMGFHSMREAEKRPYVIALREFAQKHNVGLADAAARWQHLALEGIPYLTLLHNTINHPDDRGHRLFAEELWKCFE